MPMRAWEKQKCYCIKVKSRAISRKPSIIFPRMKQNAYNIDVVFYFVRFLVLFFFCMNYRIVVILLLKFRSCKKSAQMVGDPKGCERLIDLVQFGSRGILAVAVVVVVVAFVIFVGVVVVFVVVALLLLSRFSGLFIRHD
jgi:hypothetical protein